MRPTFLTGATAKIRLNGKTLAYCTDFSCSVQVLTQTPKVLGKYEADSVEPLSYLVNGSFSVVRYAKGIKNALGNAHLPQGLAANDAGNGVGNWGTQWGGKQGDMLAANLAGNDGRANEALDPSKFANGTTFDIQVFQKVDTRDSGSSNGSTANISYLGVKNIRNARITQADFSISKKSAAIEHFMFTAIFCDGDSWVANPSAVF